MNAWDFAAAHPAWAVALALAATWGSARVVLAVGQAIAVVRQVGRREP